MSSRWILSLLLSSEDMSMRTITTGHITRNNTDDIGLPAQWTTHKSAHVAWTLTRSGRVGLYVRMYVCF